MIEVDAWRPIPGFPGYSVSIMGQVRHEANERLLRVRYNQYGVPYVGLMKDWKQYIRSLPRLVAEVFVSPPDTIFNTPMQLDGNRRNCAADNLMWRPRWYVVKYNKQFTEEPFENPILSRVRAIGEDEIFSNSLKAACRYGLLEQEVVMAVLNKTYAWPTYQTFELA